MGFWDIIKTVAPIGMQLYGMNEQSKMMKEHSKAQQKSYDKYLSTINPPADVKQSRFNELRSSVLERAPGARRGMANRLASRGIRGQGPAAPVAETDDAIQRSINDAYFKIYGQYNVPSQPGPTDYSPSFWNLMGANTGDIGSWLLANRLAGTQSGGQGSREQSSRQVLGNQPQPTAKSKDPWGWPAYAGPQQW